MTLDEVLNSPNLSEADRLVYALQIGNGEVDPFEIERAIAESIYGESTRNFPLSHESYTDFETLKFLADVVNA